MVTAVDVIGPEGRIDQSHILYGDIFTIGDIGQTRTLCILVCTLGVPLPANPELLPIVLPVAVNSSLAGNSESIQAIRIDQCHEILACLALNTCLPYLKVMYPVTTLQHPAFFYM